MIKKFTPIESSHNSYLDQTELIILFTLSLKNTSQYKVSLQKKTGNYSYWGTSLTITQRSDWICTDCCICRQKVSKESFRNIFSRKRKQSDSFAAVAGVLLLRLVATKLPPQLVSYLLTNAHCNTFFWQHFWWHFFGTIFWDTLSSGS